MQNVATDGPVHESTVSGLTPNASLYKFQVAAAHNETTGPFYGGREGPFHSANLRVSNIDVSNLDIFNLDIFNLDIFNLDIFNLDIFNLDIFNLNISNLNISNLNISHLNISNLDMTSNLNMMYLCTTLK